MRALILLVALFGCAAPPDAEVAPTVAARSPLAGAGTFERVQNFGANPGGLNMYRYIPPNAPQNAPLVVALHACSQNAPTYRNAGWEPLADQFGFYVLYPEQTAANNGLSCFNWAGEFGNGANLPRGDGENQSIINMVDHMKANYSIDARRVFTSGHSAGGAQSALMLATWPDVFAGGAMLAGIPYRCTTAFAEVSTCLSPGIPRDAQTWGQYVRDAFPEYRGPYPKVSIWQGTNDLTVAPVNATELLKQWSNVHGIGMDPSGSEMVDGHRREFFEDGDGEVVIERYTIQGGDHATFVDPDNGCGTAGAFFSDFNICSSLRIAEFFGIAGDVEPPPPMDQVPPTVNVTAPTDGATVSGMVAITADANDDTGVARVEFFVNGTSVGRANAAPFRVTWDASRVPAGTYAIRAVARDAAGNEGTDDDTEVTVDSDVVDETAPTVSITGPADGSEVSGVVTVDANADDDVGVARVTFLVDGAPIGDARARPYRVQWDTAANGPGAHTLLARAEDGAGNQAEASVMVTVVDGPAPVAPPTIKFTSPRDGADVAGVVQFTTDAASTESPLTQAVLFWVTEDRGEVALGIDRAYPFEFLWDVRQIERGPQQLIVRVFNQANGVGQDTLEVNVVDVADLPDGGVGPGPDPDPDPDVRRADDPLPAGRRYPGCATGHDPFAAGLLGLLLFFFRRRR